MWRGLVLSLLLGSVLSKPATRSPSTLSTLPQNSRRPVRIGRRQSYDVSTRYGNSTGTASTTTTTPLSTSLSLSKSTSTVDSTLTSLSTAASSTYSPTSYTTEEEPPYFPPWSTTSEVTCLTNSTVTYTGTPDPTVTSYTDEISISTLSGRSFYALATPRVVTMSDPPPCYSTLVPTYRPTYTTSPRKYDSTSQSGNNTAETLSDYNGPTYSNPASFSEGGSEPTRTGSSSFTTSSAVGTVSSRYTSTLIVTRKTIIPFAPTETRPPFSFNDQPNSPQGNDGGPNPGNTPGDTDSEGGRSGSHVTFPVLPPSGTQVVGGETIIYNPTAVIIGGSTISIPRTQGLNPPQVTVNGQTFTIYPSQIIGPSTTFNLPAATGAVFTMTQPPSTVVVDGVTVTISFSQAIISGTAYRIGIPSDPQTLTIDGHKIIFNSRGVIFPTTTLSPPLTIGVSGDDIYRIIVVDGITISIEGTDAIISGTTFKIGNAAGSASTFNIGGKTITAGPDGLVLGGTTIEPTAIDRTATMTATEGAGPTNSLATPTGHGGTQSSTDPEENFAASSRSRSGSLATLLYSLIAAYLFVV